MDEGTRQGRGLPEEPATLLWIGRTDHPECRETLRFCRRRCGQVAVRRGIADAIRRPAGYVGAVLFSRLGRDSLPVGVWQRFRQQYPQAKTIALCGMLCDGEVRTGSPWPVDVSLRFSRWQERLPGELSTCGLRRTAGDGAPATSMLIVTDRFESAEPVLDWASRSRRPAVWSRHYIPAVHRGFDRILWDDSAAPAADMAIWRTRIAADASEPASRCDRAARPIHLWAALQPTPAEIRSALDAGVDRVLTKPLDLESLER